MAARSEPGDAAKASGGTALAVTKKEKLTRTGNGRPRKQRAAEEAGPEVRRLLVARMLMARKSYREIMTALLKLPAGQRPKSVSL